MSPAKTITSSAAGVQVLPRRSIAGTRREGHWLEERRPCAYSRQRPISLAKPYRYKPATLNYTRGVCVHAHVWATPNDRPFGELRLRSPKSKRERHVYCSAKFNKNKALNQTSLSIRYQVQRSQCAKVGPLSPDYSTLCTLDIGRPMGA